MNFCAENKEKTILHLCADKGSDSLPYREAGYNVICVGKDLGVENYHPPEKVYGIIANPPCTMFSIARSKAKTPRDLRLGMNLVKECLRVIWESQYCIKENQRKPNLSFWALENPATGFLKWFLGYPHFEYEQWEFGGDAVKKTALWGMFNIPKKPLGMIKPVAGFTSDKRWLNKKGEKRSSCPKGFSKAFYEANK